MKKRMNIMLGTELRFKWGGALALGVAAFVALFGEQALAQQAGPVTVVPGGTTTTNAESVDMDHLPLQIDSRHFVPPQGKQFKNLNVDAQGHEHQPPRYADVAQDNLFTGGQVNGATNTNVQVQWLRNGALPPQTADQWVGHVSGKIVTPQGRAYGLVGADHKTIDNNWKADVKAQLKPKIVSHTVSDWVLDHTRLRVGVGEEVELRIQPEPTAAGVTVTWKKVSGSGDLADLDPVSIFGRRLLVGDKKTTADIATALKIQATVSTLAQPLEIIFTVVEPTGPVAAAIDSKASDTLNERFPLNALGAAMGISPIKMGATDVSFQWVEMWEDVVPANNITGWYKQHRPPAHTPQVGGGKGHAHGFGPGNTYNDQASIGNGRDYPNIVPRAAGETGSFAWPIAAHWQVKKKTLSVVSPVTGQITATPITYPEHRMVKEDGKTLVATPQVHTLMADQRQQPLPDGDVSITKFNLGVRRNQKNRVWYDPSTWGNP